MDFGDMTFTICYHKILLVLEEHAARYSETDFGTLKRKIVPSPPIRNLPCGTKVRKGYQQENQLGPNMVYDQNRSFVGVVTHRYVGGITVFL
jgi:hypothetical protein